MGHDGADRSKLDSWWAGHQSSSCCRKTILLYFLMCMCQIVPVEPKDTLSCYPEEHHPRFEELSLIGLEWHDWPVSPDFLLSPPPQRWDDRNTHVISAFSCEFRGTNSVPHTHKPSSPLTGLCLESQDKTFIIKMQNLHINWHSCENRILIYCW